MRSFEPQTWKQIMLNWLAAAVALTFVWALTSACGSSSSPTAPATEDALSPGVYKVQVIFTNNFDEADWASPDANGVVFFKLTHPECRKLRAELTSDQEPVIFFSCFNADGEITFYNGEAEWDEKNERISLTAELDDGIDSIGTI